MIHNYWKNQIWNPPDYSWRIQSCATSHVHISQMFVIQLDKCYFFGKVSRQQFGTGIHFSKLSGESLKADIQWLSQTMISSIMLDQQCIPCIKRFIPNPVLDTMDLWSNQLTIASQVKKCLVTLALFNNFIVTKSHNPFVPSQPQVMIFSFWWVFEFVWVMRQNRGRRRNFFSAWPGPFLPLLLRYRLELKK